MYGVIIINWANITPRGENKKEIPNLPRNSPKPPPNKIRKDRPVISGGRKMGISITPSTNCLSGKLTLDKKYAIGMEKIRERRSEIKDVIMENLTANKNSLETRVSFKP